MNNNIFDRIISEIENGNFREAISHCDELLNEYPDNRSVYEIRSGCHYAIGDFDSAINDLTYSIVKIKSGEDTVDEIISLYSKRGKIYLKKSNWVKAADDYRKILSLNENIPEVQNSLALCYRKTGSYIDALYHSSKAINLNDKYAEAYNNRANINISLEKYDEAITDYTRSIELNPLAANAYFNRGSIYYDILNDKEKASKDFLKAISINPDFKDELISHYPDFTTEEKNPEEKIIFDEIIPEQKDSEVGFSLDEFDSLFGEKKPEQVPPPIQDIKVTDENKVPNFSSLFDDKTESSIPPVSEVSKSDDIDIPTFDLKSMFADLGESEELPLQDEEPLYSDKPVISNDVKLLHEEIQSVNEKEEDTSEKMGGVNFGNMSNFENKEPVFDTNDNSKHMIKPLEEKRSFLRSPVFFIILILLMATIIVLSVLKFFKSQENQITNVQDVVRVDSSSEKNSDTLKKDVKDTVTLKETETKVESKKEEVKKVEPPPEEVKQKTELTTKNLGFISDKKQFVLFSEPDGYYVQIGSYKERPKADEKLRLLEKNNIKGKIFEVDLKEKGIFFRVRAGVFASPEEAKAKTIKIE